MPAMASCAPTAWCAVTPTVHFSAAVVFFQSASVSFSSVSAIWAAWASNSFASDSARALIRFLLFRGGTGCVDGRSISHGSRARRAPAPAGKPPGGSSPRRVRSGGRRRAGPRAGGARFGLGHARRGGAMSRQGGRQPDRPPHQLATAVRAAPAEQPTRAPATERALERADDRVRRIGRQIAITALAVRAKGETDGRRGSRRCLALTGSGLAHRLRLPGSGVACRLPLSGSGRGYGRAVARSGGRDRLPLGSGLRHRLPLAGSGRCRRRALTGSGLHARIVR